MPRTPKQIPGARIWTYAECAARLNKSVPWFYQHKNRLEQLGMPKKDGLLGGWDANAFEVWLDLRAGLLAHVDTSMERQMLEAARGKN